MSQSVSGVTLLCAFRHALYRKGHMTDAVADDLVANRDLLEPEQRRQICQDIDVAVTLSEQEGQACDVATWRRVAGAMA